VPQISSEPIKRRNACFLSKINCPWLNIFNEQTVEVLNPIITQHKGRSPKRLKASVEQGHQKRRGVLQDSTNVNSNSEINNEKDRRCDKCREFGYYSKTCSN